MAIISDIGYRHETILKEQTELQRQLLFAQDTANMIAYLELQKKTGYPPTAQQMLAVSNRLTEMPGKNTGEDYY